MNRNNEKHFNNVPETHVSRTRFKRDQNILTTFDAGKLIPFYVDEVLPGDTFDVNTAAIIRMTTPKYPVFDDAYIDFYYFFCPNRIIWDDFKYFMGEVDDKPWMPSKTYSIPKIRVKKLDNLGRTGPKEGSILDYMGIPTNIINESDPEEKEIELNALPIRAYVKIWNEFFRDQNVGNAAVLKTGNEIETYEDQGENQSTETTLQYARTGGRCLPVSRFHDYFSSCLPYPQRGPEVTIGLAGNAPVRPYEDTELKIISRTGEVNYLNGINSATAGIQLVGGTGGEGNPVKLGVNEGNPSLSEGSAAYLGADLSKIEAATINQLRQAFAVQHYYEALARGGSRYREQVRALFGVSISDKTVQVPEYLGGGRYHVNINQIVQTSGQQNTNDTPIGETGAMSVTPINESSFTKSFEEHGFIIGVMCVRHNRSYQQGLERFWSRSDRLDYYFPQFANIGEQPVKKKEIMLTGTNTDDETFGYQEAWADYRMKPDRVSGKMRSNAQGTLDFWHYADNYNEVPTLSQEWMNEGKTEIARTLIVQDEPQFFGGIRVMNKTTRCMPLYSVPGLNKL
ncbi:Capsid protein (F protein) [Chlamydia trachomatis]|nr:Capsid protein (F protein) [Chlamydia trachomatis]